MRHRKTKKTLDRTSAQRQKLLRNLAMSLIKHERITTTRPRAKLTRQLTEKLISHSKRTDLQSRRYLIQNIGDRPTVSKLINELGQRFKKRNGGYTRQVLIGQRKGDGSEKIMVELLKE